MGVPVGDILLMNRAEFTGWMQYFAKRPYGWEDDLRTYRVMQASGNLKKENKPYDFFPSLRIIMGQATTFEGEEKGMMSKSSFERSPFAAMLHEHWKENNGSNTNQEPGSGVRSPDQQSPQGS